MSDNTHIQWSDATWNTITGCTRVSDGCLNCYIDRTPPFRMAHRRFDSPRIGGTTGVIVHPDRVTLPLKWRKPRRIFVNSLSDLFHDDVPTDHIAQVFAVMAAAPHHTYQVLTKRPARMRSLLSSGVFRQQVMGAGGRLGLGARIPAAMDGGGLPQIVWPLPSVHVGVSVEDQQWADIRIPLLVETPAAVRFLSCEPLLGPIRLTRHHAHCPTHDFPGGFCTGGCPDLILPDWAIIGGESGPGARPMEVAWARSLLADCRYAGIAPFVKQLGSAWARESGAADRKGGDPAEWPEGLRVREMPRDSTAAVSA